MHLERPPTGCPGRESVSDDLRRAVPLIVDEADVLPVGRARPDVNRLDVMTAEDGEQARTRFRERSPDLVLLDPEISKVDGFRVCQAPNASPASRDVSVIMTSASGHKRAVDLQGCLEQGAVDHAHGPYLAEELVVKVNRRLALKVSPPT